jgi:hypothetical protein
MESWSDYAEYHHESGLDHSDRHTLFDETTCVARIMRRDHSGENRFYIAPTEDGMWFAWGDWHGRVESENRASRATDVSETADDATYTFVDGGAYFQTREQATGAVYRWIHRDLALEKEYPTAQGSVANAYTPRALTNPF